jgi:hypothetical protein
LWIGLALLLAVASRAQGQSSGGWVPRALSVSQTAAAPEAVPVPEAPPALEPPLSPTPPVPSPPIASREPSADVPLSSLLTPLPPLDYLPQIQPDPPVPYFSAYQGAENVEPSGPILEVPGAKLGWLYSAEVSYIQPFVHNGLNSGPGAIGTVPESVNVPQARATGTAFPRIDIGYRFEDGLGEVHAIFRTLSDTSTRTIGGFDTAGSGTVTSHLNMNVFDLEYGFLEFNAAKVPRINPLLLIPGRLGLNLHPEDDEPTPLMMKWFAGVRAANVYFDSQGTGGQILSERVTNNFVGAGPRLAMEFTKPLPGRALALYGRFETSGLFGRTTQSFSRTETLPGGGTATGYEAPGRTSLGVPVLDASCGVRYVPQWRNRMLRLTGGYLYEQWFYLGQTGTSDAGLTLNGAFLRAEWGF